MASNSYRDASLDAHEHRELIEVDAATLPPDKRLPFDSYTKHDSFTIPILPRETNFDGQTRQRLCSVSGSKVWIPTSQRQDYFEHIGQHLASFLHGSTDSDRKAAVATTTTQQLAIQVFDDADPASLRICIPILGHATSWLGRLEEPIPLPPVGQDHEPARHAANVCISSLALFAKVDASAIRDNPDSAVGAFLHDIGMAGRLQEFAGRAGELKFAEHALMRRHTQWNIEQVAEGVSLNSAVVDVLRHHHERMDGKGYPDRLVAESISLPARVVAIASVFNALTSKTPRRRAYSAYEALAVMGREMAGHFDPNLLRAFVGLLG